MDGTATQQTIEHEFETLTSSSTEVSIYLLRLLLIDAILKYIEGKVSLHFILSIGAKIYRQYKTQLTLDLIETTGTLSDLAEHTDTAKPRTFIENQQIEDQLVTVLQKLTNRPFS